MVRCSQSKWQVKATAQLSPFAGPNRPRRELLVRTDGCRGSVRVRSNFTLSPSHSRVTPLAEERKRLAAGRAG